MMWMVPLLLMGVVVLLVVSSSHRAPERRSGSQAQEILDQRLVTGEVGSEEHARRSATLAEHRGGSSGRRGVLIVGTVAVVALLGGAVAWGGIGSDWPQHDRWMAGHMGWTTTGSADAVAPDAPTFEVVATDLAFEPTTVTVPAGTRVNLKLVNEGRAFHDLTIPELGFVLGAEAGETVSGSVVAPDPGTYEFVCSVPGHEAAGMRGRLVVTEPTT